MSGPERGGKAQGYAELLEHPKELCRRDAMLSKAGGPLDPHGFLIQCEADCSLAWPSPASLTHPGP
jgi:hypothetical protein